MKQKTLGMVMAGTFAALFVATAAWAADRVIAPLDVQASAQVGVTIVVKKITVSDDATVVNLVASFDSKQTNYVNLADADTFLDVGMDRRLSLRQPQGNPDLRISNGQSMEGDLVFPGRIPADAREVTLVFNKGNDGSDTSAPGLTLKISLPELK